MSRGRTLVIGADSLIGGALLRRLRQQDAETFATTRRPGQGPQLDLQAAARPDWRALFAAGYRQAVVAVGISRIGVCETQPELSRWLNVDAILALALELSEAGILPVLFSSDYVFGGDAADTPPYADASQPCPLNVYGQQKAELEARLPQVCGQHWLCLRLSKVYTATPGDGTLLAEMLSHLERGQPIRAATDQIFNPVRIEDVLDQLLALPARGARGLYNLAGPEPWSRYDLARRAASAWDFDAGLIEPILLENLHESFVRPRSTLLRNERLEAEFGELKLISMAESLGALAEAHRS